MRGFGFDAAPTGMRRQLSSPEVAVPQGGLRGSVGFVRIAQLVPLEQEVVTVPIGTEAGSALDLMEARGFDQLPVVNPLSRVIGVFTYRSFSQQIVHLRTQDDPRAAPVDDLIEELRFVRPSDNVEEILPWIDSDNAVLVGDDDRLLAIVTASDVTSFLWRRTRPFVLLQDIELATRELMRSACSDSELFDCLAAVLATEEDAAHSAASLEDFALEDLTLHELHSVLLHKASYGRYFRTTFGRSRELVQSTLEPVREIRNKVVHFRGFVSDEEIGTLLRAAALLRRRLLIREGA
ncbi:CBS domain-containing protein [Kribbella sp. NBC_01484]|uniref:CBS domain-containing protein n=1 Tax=Kribbella sp. NBC_01484 TaxID=2903579 RepID=UPI002E342648|nr:CBS domain-containing protein [Kribbella sp. NBC_01484]